VADASLLRGGTASARLALAWSNHRLLLWNAGARWPRQHAAQSCGRGEERPGHRAWCFERRASLRISDDQRSGPRQASHVDPEPPMGGLATTPRGKSSSDDRIGSRVPLMLTHSRAQNSRPYGGSCPQLPLTGCGRGLVVSCRRLGAELAAGPGLLPGLLEPLSGTTGPSPYRQVGQPCQRR
jgi:hypothetical protein